MARKFYACEQPDSEHAKLYEVSAQEIALEYITSIMPEMEPQEPHGVGVALGGNIADNIVAAAGIDPAQVALIIKNGVQISTDLVSITGRLAALVAAWLPTPPSTP